VSVGRAARGVVQGMAGRAIFFGVAYLASVIMARKLGPATYGVYGVVMSVLLWVEQIGKFTLAPAAAKLIPERAERSLPLEQTAFTLNSLLFVSLFAALFAGAPLFARLFDLGDGGTALFRIAALDLPLFGMYTIYRGVLLGHREFLSTSVADVAYSVTKLVAVLVLLTIWLSPASALMTNVAASAGALIYVMSRISIRVRRPDRAMVAPLVRLAMPLGFYMLALQTIGSLDLWFLKVLTPGGGSDTIGLYVAARNVAIVPSMVFMVISDVLLPSLSRALAANDVELAQQHLQGAVRFLVMIMLPLACLLTFGADTIMVRLYSDRFAGGGLYLRILLWYSVSLAFVDLFAAALNARGEPIVSGTSLSALIPIAVFLNWLLVPAYGAVGAAWASALSGAAGIVILGTLVHRRFGALITRSSLIRTSVALLLLVALASFVHGSLVVLAASYLGCLVIYLGVLALLGELTTGDLRPFAFWRSVS
jgi:O-antigen/teichoic acid export membrane protein